MNTERNRLRRIAKLRTQISAVNQTLHRPPRYKKLSHRWYVRLETTRCVAHNFWAIDGGRSCRVPARCDASLQKLRWRWSMIPPGDRAEAAKSRTIKY